MNNVLERSKLWDFIEERWVFSKEAVSGGEGEREPREEVAPSSGRSGNSVKLKQLLYWEGGERCRNVEGERGRAGFLLLLGAPSTPLHGFLDHWPLCPSASAPQCL